MRKPWKNLLLIFIFLVLQVFLSAHSFEHLNEEHIDTTRCDLCIYQYQLGNAVKTALFVQEVKTASQDVLRHHRIEFVSILIYKDLQIRAPPRQQNQIKIKPTIFL